MNWAWAAGSLPGNLLVSGLPGGDGVVVLLLGQEALADLEEDLGTRPSSGFWATNAFQAARASAYCSAREVVGGDQELGVEDRALGVGALGAVGETWPGSPSRRRSPRRTSAAPGGSGRYWNVAVMASSAWSRRASSVSALKPSSLRNRESAARAWSLLPRAR